MSSFKVGDLITISGGKPWKATEDEVRIYRGKEDEDIKLWRPKEGEWCWFWNNSKDLTLQKFWKIEQEYFISFFCDKNKSDGLVFYNVTEKNFKYCEPFVGELPSLLREVK